MTLAEILVRIGVDASRVATGVTQAERTLERLGSRLFSMGARITAGVSAPVALASRQILKLGEDFDQAMTEAVAIMDDVTPQIRARMESVAKGITETTKFSATEGAAAFYDLASAGLDATGVIEGLPVVAKFAQAGLMDLATAGEYLAGAQAALGDSAANSTQRIAEMAHIGDVLTKANNIALGTVEDFSRALTNKAGQQLRIFNKDVEEGVAVLTAYAQQNIKGANAGTQLYMALRDLARFATKNAEAFKANNIAVFDGAGNMRHMADIIKDFEVRLEGASNKQAAFLFQQLGMTDRSRAATQALIGYSDSIRNADVALHQAGGTMDEVSRKQMESIKAQLKSLGNQFKVLAIDIFQQFEPVIREKVIPAFQSILAKGKEFVEWLKTLSTDSKSAILAVAGFTAVLGPLVSFIGSWMMLASLLAKPLAPILDVIGLAATEAGGAMGAAAPQAGFLSNAFSGLAGVARAIATPLGGLILVIGAVVLAVKNLAGSWSNFYTLIEPGIPPLMLIRNAWDLIDDALYRLMPTLGSIGRLFKETFLFLGTGAVEGVKILIGWLDRIVDHSVNKAKEFGAGITRWIELIQYMTPVVFPGLQKFLDLWDRIGEAAEKAATYMERIRKWGFGGETKFVPSSERGDIQMGPNLGSGKGPLQTYPDAGGYQLPRNNYGLLDLTPQFNGPQVRTITPPQDDDIGSGPAKPTTMMKRFQEEVKNIEAAMKSAFKEKIPLQLILEEFGDELLTIARKSKIFGVELQANTRKAYLAVTSFEMGEFMKKQSSGVAAATKDILSAIGLSMTPPNANESIKAWADIEQKMIEGAQRLQDMRAVGREKDILGLERQRQAEHDVITAATGQTADQMAIRRQHVDAYYDHQIAKARTSQDTLVERMREANVLTRGEMGKTAVAAQKTFEQMKEHNRTATDGMKFSAEEVYKAWKKWYDLMNQDAPLTKLQGFLKNVHTSLSPLLEAFKNLADVAGDSGIGKFADAVGHLLTTFDLTIEGANKVVTSIMGIQEAMKMSAAGVDGWGVKMAENMIGLAAGIVSGVSGLMSATEGGSTGQRLTGGAMSGAALGGTVGAGLAAAGIIGTASVKGMAVAGIWGAAAGAIVGIMIAVFRGADTRRLMRKVGEEWGVDISEGLAKSIQKDAKALFRGEDVAASVFRMKDILGEEGGVNSANLDKFTHRLRDVFTMLQRGLFDTFQAEKVVAENFGAISSAVISTGEVASREFTDIIRMTKEWGLNVKEVTDFLNGQTARFGTSMQAIVNFTARGFTGLAEKITEAKDRLAELTEKGEDVEGIKKAQAEVNLLLAQQAHYAANTADDLERVAFIMLAGFNAAISSGANVLTAIEGMGGSIDALAQAYTDMGIASDNAAVQQLLAIGTLRRENPTLLAGIGALAEGLLALSMLGGLNAETFAAMQLQGTEMYTVLQAEAERLGLSQATAVGMMIPYLKAVISGNKEYGFEIDENTQKLIDQAREMGLLKEDQLDTNQILLLGLGAIIEAVGGELPAAFRAAADAAGVAFGDVADDAAQAVSDAEAAFRNFDPGTIRVPYSFEQHGDGPSVSGTDLDVPQLAAGGIVRKATLAVVGEKGPEMITPLDNAMNYLHSNQRESGDTYIVMDGHKVGKLLTKRQGAFLRSRGVR